MRTLVIGDIHGYHDALDALLELVCPTQEDRLITLGDYVDRGPDSALVLKRLVQLFDAGRLIALRGNHDEMMVQGRVQCSNRRFWLRFGGVKTLESYGHRADDEVYYHIPARHWQFLEKDCRNWYETETHIYAHGWIDPDVPMDEQDSSVLLWEKLIVPADHMSGKVLICGHTKQPGLPLDLGSTICIDTGIYEPDGWLTCLHVERGYYYQANQKRQRRQGTLEELAEQSGG